MNGFRLVGDFLHLFAIVLLVTKLIKTKSCAGISGKTQLLFAIVYMTRYLDLLEYFVSFYNTALKVMFISLSLLTVGLIFIVYHKTYEHALDTFLTEMLLVPAFILALYENYDLNSREVLWTFSEYLEAVAILPQLFLLFKSRKVGKWLCCYLFVLAAYRSFYIFNWIWRYFDENHYDFISSYSGSFETALIFFTFIIAVRAAVFKNTEAEDLPPKYSEVNVAPPDYLKVQMLDVGKY